MIKYIIHTGDIHIRNNRRMDEYKTKLQWFIDKCTKFCKEHNPEEVRIVVAGDIVHSKTELSPECYTMVSWFFNELDNICKTIVIAGNHDKIQNFDRLDPLTAIFNMCNFKQVYFLDMETGYASDCFSDDNVIWCLYSCFDNFAKPPIKEAAISSPNSALIGLFHGELTSSKTDTGYVSSEGIDPSYFADVDFALMGHIHKRQCIDYEGTKLVYCGSLVQQDHGENLSKHGFLIWDIESQTYQEVDYSDENYGFYTFKIKNEEDIEKDEEEILNL
jgi:DNA repair exonuclease SbcCD nuclease subunit